MKKNPRIYVADHEGFIGGALLAELKRKGYKNLIVRSRKALDLKDRFAVRKFFASAKPEYVFLAAQRSGSIAANIKYPAEFAYENLVMQTNVIDAAAKNKVKKLLFFGASCMYPKAAKQPIKEESLYQGPLEETSIAYASAKLAGVEMCAAYGRQYGLKSVVVVPATVYGPGAHFDPESSHVLTALIGNFRKAVKKNKKEIILWGSGKPLREFIYIDDLARACVFLMESDVASGLYNVGSGEEKSIRVLANMVARVAGYKGTIRFDRTKPDGAMRKILSSAKLRALGWKPRVGLAKGIESAYNI